MHQQQPARRAKKTAADILYPNKQQTTHAPTLELEVEQYLTSVTQDIGIVEFWQVSD
jgi:hypothetical protein